MRSCSVSPMPTRIPLVNGILSSPAARIVSRRRAGCLVGEPACTVSISRSDTDSSISPCEAVTSRSRARSRAIEHAEVGVRQQAPLERPLAHPHDVSGEVLVPVLAQPRAHLGVDLRALAGQHQQLLDLPAGRPVEDLEHLLGRVQMGRVGGERAVLAVAPARPRQRQRQVAREGDPATHAGAVYDLLLLPAGPRPAPQRARRLRARIGSVPTNIYLARHGQTAYNLEGRFQGQLPVPLDDTGRDQAAELAERAAGHGFRALWSSPLLRARETAQIVARRIGLEPTRGPAPDGDRRRRLDRSQLRRRCSAQAPELFAAFVAGDPSFAFPGGESFAEQEVRVGAALDEVERGDAARAGRLPRHGHSRRPVGARRPLAARAGSGCPTARSSRSTPPRRARAGLRRDAATQAS